MSKLDEKSMETLCWGYGNNDREMSSVALGKSANESGKIRKIS